MKFKIDAGVEVDLASPEDVRRIVGDALTGWRVELARGTRFRHPGKLAVATAGGAVTLGPDDLGPLDGFVWSITRMTVSGLTAAQVINAFINDTTAVLAVGRFIETANTMTFGQRGLILNGNEKLILNGAGLTAAGTYGVALEVTELPVQLASWLL